MLNYYLWANFVTIYTNVKCFDVVFQKLDFVACLPPSGGDGSEKYEYLIDRVEAEVESSYVLIGAFEICNVFFLA